MELKSVFGYPLVRSGWCAGTVLVMLGQRKQLSLDVSNRIVAYAVMTQPGLCFCERLRITLYRGPGDCHANGVT